MADLTRKVPAFLDEQGRVVIEKEDLAKLGSDANKQGYQYGALAGIVVGGFLGWLIFKPKKKKSFSEWVGSSDYYRKRR